MSAFETVEEFVLLVAKYCCLLIECIGLGILVISAVKALIGILSSKKDNVRLKLMEGISTALEFLLCGEVIKTIPVDFDFVKMDEGVAYISVEEYVKKMFDGFDSGSFNGRYTDAEGNEYVQKRELTYEGQPQFIYEIANQDYEKPVFKRANAFNFLSNHVSKEEGVISVKVAINKDLVPAIQIRFAAPMTEEKLWNMLNEDPWTITYARDDVREQPAKIKFETPGVVYPYVAE